LSSKFINFTVYKYGRGGSADSVVGWVEGDDSLCQDPYNNFLFADVHLPSASIVPRACISQNVTVHSGPWISSFSLDNGLMATGSCNAEGTDAQLLIFDTATAAALVNSALQGLPEALQAYQNLIWVWSLDFV